MIRVLVAEDRPTASAGLLEPLSAQPDLEIVAEVGSGTEIVPAALTYRPDLALIDIDLPGMDGIEAAAVLRTQLARCRTLILTGVTRPGQLRRALGAGVRGVLPRDAPHAELVRAVRDVAAGGHALDAAAALAALLAPPNPLNQRETEVLRLSASGARPAAIAERLFLTCGTVRNYLSSAVGKLGARDRAEAIRIATESHWI